MNSEDIISHMAGDFADYLNDAFGYADPADEYTGIVRDVFGESPTEESVLRIFNSTTGIATLSERMRAWCENDELNDEFVAQMLRRAVINNFGPNALPNR